MSTQPIKNRIERRQWLKFLIPVIDWLRHHVRKHQPGAVLAGVIVLHILQSMPANPHSTKEPTPS